MKHYHETTITRFTHSPTLGCPHLVHTSPSANQRATMKTNLVTLLNQQNGPDGWRAVVLDDIFFEDPQDFRNGMSPMEILLISGLPSLRIKMIGHVDCPFNCLASQVDYQVIFLCSLTPAQATPLQAQETEHGAWRIRTDAWLVSSIIPT